MDFGVGHGVDMGVAGSGARVAWARYRMRRAEMGEWTRGWRNAGHLRFGGNQGGDRGSDWAKFTRECPSLSPPIMKRRRLRAF